MSNVARRLALAAVALAANGTVALAQSAMTADVPFSFVTPGATMQPGKYEIAKLSSGTSSAYFRIQNLESGKTVLVLAPENTRRTENDDGSGLLTFDCAGELCALKAVYPAHASVGHGVAGRLVARRTAGQVAEVRVPAR